MALDAELVRRCEAWFDHPDTIRFLGGRDWLHRELRLVQEVIGKRLEGRFVEGRYSWVAREGGHAIAIVGAETYDDRTASIYVVVDPSERGRGVGRRALAVLAGRSELAEVERFVGGVEPDNAPSILMLRAIGAEISEAPDEEGMLVASVRRG